ncbi:hypothetical protein ARAM_003260 [Aspergillus rambellii]|uniref:BZIP domain-containing protein n=1 Tax=Aspergillus rambellii TaxID=308745 RepID=A0A0F8XUS6_9EURO|nr:hypothetical protein ARAM_003260 [Aspergillus rambellii]
METGIRAPYPSSNLLPFPSSYHDSSIPLGLIYELDSYRAPQDIAMTSVVSYGGNRSPPPLWSSASSAVPSPDLDSVFSHSQEGDLEETSIQQIVHNNFKDNREAQRRFRQRKEQRQQNLQQKIQDLQVGYRSLSEQSAKHSDHVKQLLEENSGLKCEVKNLRRRWRMMMTLLQQPPNSPSLSTRFVEQGYLDSVLRQLEELTDDDPHNSSC